MAVLALRRRSPGFDRSAPVRRAGSTPRALTLRAGRCSAESRRSLGRAPALVAGTPDMSRRFGRSALIVLAGLGVLLAGRAPVGAARDRPARGAGPDPEAHRPRRRHRGRRPQPVHRPPGDQEVPSGRSRGSRALRGVRAVRRPAVAAGAPALPRPRGRDRPGRADGPHRAHGAGGVQLLRPLGGGRGAGAGAGPAGAAGPSPWSVCASRAAGCRWTTGRLAADRVAGPGPRRGRDEPHDAVDGRAGPADPPRPGQRGRARR